MPAGRAATHLIIALIVFALTLSPACDTRVTAAGRQYQRLLISTGKAISLPGSSLAGLDASSLYDIPETGLLDPIIVSLRLDQLR
jgi:hypothetical protein